ncbi:MAG: lytic transglycosylase domain-containing protein [Candidatus Berkelbacteria bacterium]|nr:lytic transglycosylase domain-containing protein [Candidatus Berkelbacteria bacterium]
MIKTIQNIFYRSMAIMVTIPITLGNTVPMPSQFAQVIETEKNSTDTKEAETKLVLDTKNPLVIVAKEKQIEIKTVESNFDKEQRLAKEEAAKLAVLGKNIRRDVVSRERVRYTPSDPDLAQKRKLVQEAAARYGIPWKVLEAVWQVETGKSWDTGKQSYAGAAGPMQFMRGTWARYGVDANGDGVADVTSAHDAVYGAANYLAANGAGSGDLHRALFAYNHSDSYVNKVLSIANSI